MTLEEVQAVAAKLEREWMLESANGDFPSPFQSGFILAYEMVGVEIRKWKSMEAIYEDIVKEVERLKNREIHLKEEIQTCYDVINNNRSVESIRPFEALTKSEAEWQDMAHKMGTALEGAQHMFKAIEEDLMDLNPTKDCTNKCSSSGHDVLCGTAGLLALHDDEEVIAVSEAIEAHNRLKAQKGGAR